MVGRPRGSATAPRTSGSRPASESTPYPQGVAVQNVPDMVGAGAPAGVPDCTPATDGCQTFYYTNQQSARLMFYHDHAWGITRLNVYAGEAAGYVLTDATEQKLIGTGGPLAGLGVGIPLVIQDRTFVPTAAQLAGQDPTWDASKWGGLGNLWYHHVYMPAQNPADPSGMSAYGRWFYGPWFWPPATPQNAPIANPYYKMDPKGPDGVMGVPGSPEAADDFTTAAGDAVRSQRPRHVQYQVEPFCEPPTIPGTPNISVGMEQFNDTPIVNGTAYPTTTVDPKAYRFRILNAANDRVWNLSWYVADSTGTEVALNAAELAAAQTDPNIVPTPDTTVSPPGPSWIQIGTEGGFLPAPAVVPPQPTTWIIDPTRFDVGNVDKHSLVLAPAERGDVIVDFSKFAGKTLILYNDAPAAYPGRVATYDYYTGMPGPRRRTGPARLRPEHSDRHAGQDQCQRRSAGVQPDGAQQRLQAPRRRLRRLRVQPGPDHRRPGRLQQRLRHELRRQRRLHQPDRAPTSATGSPASPSRVVRPSGSTPSRVHTAEGQDRAEGDARRDELGRLRRVRADDGQPRPRSRCRRPRPRRTSCCIRTSRLRPRSSTGRTCRGRLNVTPISSGTDGTQIWKITHNGVDTHPIHFHLYNVQILNRVTWDNIIIPPEAVGTRLEGDHPGQPAGGHDRRPPADHPDGAVRGPEQHPATQSDDAARREP